MAIGSASVHFALDGAVDWSSFGNSQCVKCFVAFLILFGSFLLHEPIQPEVSAQYHARFEDPVHLFRPDATRLFSNTSVR